MVGKFKLETPKNIWIDEFVCLRSKVYSFTWGDVSKIKLKGVSKSQSKSFKFEEYQKDCDNYIIRSINHEVYLQKVKKSTLSF